jgi:non-heme chloroperoxidase
MMTEPGQPQTVRVNDVDLAYVAQGRGDAVVFVHGSVNDYRSWRTQMAPFAERYRVVSYSRRYHWPNARPNEGVAYAAAQHAADLGALIEALDLAPAHVVGSSFGALTALTCAVARPELIRSLVLGEPPLLPWLARLPDGAAILEAFMATSFGPARQAFARGEAEAGVRTFIDGVIGPGAFDRLPPEARGMMLDNAAAERAETMTPSEQYFPALSADDVGRLPMPVLLVEGEVSPRMFGPITDELARALPEAERATISAASHGMHAQNPAAYSAVVLAFLAKQ